MGGEEHEARRRVPPNQVKPCGLRVRSCAVGAMDHAAHAGADLALGRQWGRGVGPGLRASDRPERTAWCVLASLLFTPLDWSNA